MPGWECDWPGCNEAWRRPCSLLTEVCTLLHAYIVCVFWSACYSLLCVCTCVCVCWCVYACMDTYMFLHSRRYGRTCAGSIGVHLHKFLDVSFCRSVEINNPDAEGRLVLGDGVSDNIFHVSKKKLSNIFMILLFSLHQETLLCVFVWLLPVHFFFFEILLDLSQGVPNHLADESQTCQPDLPLDHPHVVYPANVFDSRLRGE